MGASLSSSYTQSIIDDYNANLTNIMVNNSSSSLSTCKTNQRITIDELILVNCPVAIDQNSQVVCNLKSEFSGSNTANLSSMLQSAVDNSAETSQKSTQGFLATSVSASVSATDMRTYIKNIIQTNVNQSLVESCITESNVDQDNHLKKISCNSGKVNVGQNAQLNQFSSCMTTMVVDLLKNDTIVTKAISKAVTEQTTTQKGLDSLLEALLGPLIVVAIVMIIGLVIYKQMKSDKKESVS